MLETVVAVFTAWQGALGTSMDSKRICVEMRSSHCGARNAKIELRDAKGNCVLMVALAGGLGECQGHFYIIVCGCCLWLGGVLA